MADDRKYSKTVYLMLTSDGRVSLEKIIQDGSFEPLELDPEIELAPISIQDLIRISTTNILKYPDEEDTSELEDILSHFETGADIIKSAIKKRDSKT